MLFLIKKILGALLMPLPMAFLIMGLAFVLVKKGFQQQGKVLALISGLLLYGVSLSPVANWLAAPLEYAHPKYQNQSVDFVVVLGGGHKIDERQPITSRLYSTSWVRLSEGIRVLNLNPNAKLLLSGYEGRETISNAEAMASVARVFGVSDENMILKTKPKDTAEEAKAWHAEIGNEPFALVTSATHMPRAMRLFEQLGMNPISAPTGFRTAGEDGLNWRHFVPESEALDLSTKAWHEYLGMIWIWIRS